VAHRDWYCEDVLSGKLPVQTAWEDEWAPRRTCTGTWWVPASWS